MAESSARQSEYTTTQTMRIPSPGSAQTQHHGFPQKHDESLHKEGAMPTVIQYAPTTTYTTKPTRIPSRSIPSQIRQRWNSLTRRTKIIIVATMVLLILAIVLGAALGATTGRRAAGPPTVGGVHTGQLTYFSPALGACGVVNSEADMVVAISHEMWDTVQVGTNPNANPLCGKRLRLYGPIGTIDVKVADRCPAATCTFWNVDASKGAFDKIAHEADGRVTFTWQWLDPVPAAVA